MKDSIKNNRKMKIKRYLSVLLLMTTSISAHSQLNPMGSLYYQNQYLANPALAGVATGWELNAGYKGQWSNTEGAPKMQAVTATYGSESNKVGLGLNFYNEKAGLIQQTSFKATYAYHLPLNGESSYLDFGLSAGLTNESLDMAMLNGNSGDVVLSNFRDRKAYFDGDFGLAFRSRGLTVQAALPNMKRFFDSDPDPDRPSVDQPQYYAAASYKLINDNAAINSLEPKVAYRSIKNYNGIVDLGLNAMFFTDKLTLTGVYHTTKSVTAGIGTTYQKKLSIIVFYTTNTAVMQNYSNGEFEAGLKYSF